MLESKSTISNGMYRTLLNLTGKKAAIVDVRNYLIEEASDEFKDVFLISGDNKNIYSVIGEPTLFSDCPIKEAVNRGEITSRKVFNTNTDSLMTVTVVPVKEGTETNKVIVIVDRDNLGEHAEYIRGERIKILGEMAAGVAHNFNNILAAISGRAQLLLNVEKDKKKRDWIEKIEQLSMEGSAIVKRIQNFTKIQQEDVFKPINLITVVKDSVEISRPYWEDIVNKKGIKVLLKEEYESDNIYIKGQESQLKEVFTNIIINAVDAMPSGGTVKIKVYKKNNDAIVEISDTGKGMSRDVIKRIFDPFFTTKGDKGNGLGLSISYNIVLHHKGKIDVFSKEGVGSRFLIYLPLTMEKPLINKEEHVDITTNMKDLAVLIVDDEKELRELFREIFYQIGIKKVFLAKDGKEALNVLNKHKVDIVCSDLGMPEMNGLQLAEKIKKINSDIKIILLTGWGDKEIENETNMKYVSTIITKPFTVDQLIKGILKACNI